MKIDGWEWVEVPLGEIGLCKTFDDLTNRYRGASPVGIVTRLAGLGDFVVINLLAPKNTAFWSAARFSVFNRAQQHLLEAGCGSKNKRLFLKDLRKADIKLKDPAIRLFDLYTEFFPSQSNYMPGFSEDGVSEPERCRMVSTGCHVTLLPRLMEYFNSELEQFGEYAFFQIDERLSMGSPTQYSRLNSAAYIFRLWESSPGCGTECREAWQKDILFQLERALARIDVGAYLDIPIEPIIILRPCPSFILRGDESPDQYREVDDPIARRILSLRARLIHKLAWPIFYDDIVIALAQPEHEPRRLDDYGTFEPYDVITELEAYRVEMEAFYPCLLNSPF